MSWAPWWRVASFAAGTKPAPKTLMTYTASADQFVAWLGDVGVTDIDQVRASHVEDFIIYLLDTRSAATASVV
jgi:site-specific recombinase XerD